MGDAQDYDFANEDERMDATVRQCLSGCQAPSPCRCSCWCHFKAKPVPKPVPRPVPTPVKARKPTTYDIAKAYLESLHCTLWPGEAWYIRTEDGQDAAAVWITQMVDTVNAIRNMVSASDSMTVQQAAEDYRRMTEEGLI